MSYSELLKHPKWQKKRLKILERAKFQCELCGDTEATLHIHHGYYEKGLKPWEYPDDSLHCLCEGCHAETEDWLKQIKQLLGKALPANLERIFGYLFGLDLLGLSEAIIDCYSDEFSLGVGDAFGVPLQWITDIAIRNNDLISTEQLRCLSKANSIVPKKK